MPATSASTSIQLCQDEIRDLLYGKDGARQFELAHAAIAGPLFGMRSESLSADQRCATAYTRLRVLGHRLGSAVDLVRDPRRLFAVLETTAVVDGTLHALAAIHYNLCLGTILDNASQRPDLAHHIQALDTMRSVGVFLATELGYGNNVAGLETQAELDHTNNEFILHTPSNRAWKFMPNTAFPAPKLAVVMARLRISGTDCGVFPFVVPIRNKSGPCDGVRVVALPEKPGLDLDNAMTSFDQVRLPRSAILLGEHSSLDSAGEFHSTIGKQERFNRAMSRVTQGKLGVTGAHLSCARAALTIAIRYAAQRLTFGPDGSPVPILAYRNTQRALMGGVANAYAMTFLLQRARAEYLASSGRPSAVIDRIAAVAKALGSWTAQDIVLTCRERCGAQGMFAHNHIANYVAVGHSVITSEGDNEVIAIKAGQQITLGRYYEPPPMAPEEFARDITDLRWSIAMLGHREVLYQRDAMARVQAGLRDGEPAFDVWNGAVNHVLRLTRAHGMRLALETSVNVIEHIHHQETKRVLGRLMLLFALTEIERDAGSLLASNALTAERFHELPIVLDALCAELSTGAQGLIDAFLVPDQVLEAPIASPDYVGAYEKFAADRM